MTTHAEFFTTKPPAPNTKPGTKGYSNIWEEELLQKASEP